MGGGGAEVNDELLSEEGGEEAEPEEDPQGVPRTFFPLVDETPVEDDLVDDDDKWVDNFEEGNGIQVDVGVENTEVISPEHDDAWWFNERNARDFFLRKAHVDFDSGISSGRRGRHLDALWRWHGPISSYSLSYGFA